MAKTAAELLADGTIIQDSNESTKALFPVDFVIPKDAIDAGAFELFAAAHGWVATVPQLDENNDIVLDQDNKAILIENPVNAYEFSRAAIRDYAKGVLKKALLQQGEQQGRQAAQAQFNSLDI